MKMLSINFTCLILLGVTANVLGHTKVPCELNDEACLTESAKRLYREFVAGSPDIGLETSDPLHDDVIASVSPKLNYTVHDAYLYGLKDCHVDELKLELKEMSSFFYIVCPRLILEGNYYNKGYIYSEYVEGKGKCKIIYDDYHIGIRANVEKFEGTDGQAHLKYKSFVLNPLEVDGGVVYLFDNLFYGNEERSTSAHNYLNDNWKKISDGTQPPIMYSFMRKLLENVNEYLKAFSTKDIFYKYV